MKTRAGEKYQFDDRDGAIVNERITAYAKRTGPRVGDYITFANDVERRISHVWDADWNEDGIASYQTSDSGSYHMGNGGFGAWESGERGTYVSFSGALHHSVKGTTLRRAPGVKDAWVWIFHHDLAGAGCAVHATIPARMYRSTDRAPA